MRMEFSLTPSCWPPCARHPHRPAPPNQDAALQGLVETGIKASVLSIGYEYYEQQAGVAFLTGWNNLVAAGASEGLSILIWSGDWGSSSDEGGVLAKQCNSTIGNKISPACLFNNVRVGGNAQPCVAGTGTLNITKLMYNY